MLRLISFFLLFLSVVVSLFSQSPFSPYHERNDFLLTSPGAMKFGLYGYDNPALLTYVREPDLLFTWWDKTAKWNQLKRWGLFIGVPNLGFGTIHEQTPAGHYADYSLALGTGDRSISSGISYGWTITDHPTLDRSSILTFGSLVRPMPHLSIGTSYIHALNTKGWEAVGEVAVRPFGNERVAAFAEYILHRTPLLHEDMWSAGVAVEALPGIRITGRYFNTDAFSIGFQFSLGRIGFETQAQYDKNGRYAYNNYGIRFGAYDRNILAAYFPSKDKFVEMNQPGQINYQRYILFDNTQVLSDLLNTIDAAKKDPMVSGIAINTSGLDINSGRFSEMRDNEKLWEIREKLKDFKTSGKKVFIFIDNSNLDLYYFASVADKIVMDPLGTIMLEGYISGKTYFKGTLEKLGIGFDEWRLNKYKSAYEVFSEDKMSDADREQWQKLINDWYKISKEGICEARQLAPEKFDTFVNEKIVFLAQQAKEKGLVDTLGRWDLVRILVKKETGSETAFISSSSLVKFHLPYDNRWSEPPHIAVIYALGVCAMDEGISARELVKDVEAAVEDTRVKAIVLRVDSPGGDGIASDYIAEAMKKAKGKKPIIVSQGFVAGSGGYWLSMYADTIVAAPSTITGSIGGIGGWIYNKGLKETLGMSTDLVKVGEHADLGFGFRTPFIGLGIPDRNLTLEERSQIESVLKEYYKIFVEKVSLGRKKNYTDIDSIAQGRIWSGLDAQKNGLIDVLGGLETAINIAKERAGIPKDQEVTLVELPKKGLFNFSRLMPKLSGIETNETTDPTIEFLKFRLKHNGKPLLMMPMEDLNSLGAFK